MAMNRQEQELYRRKAAVLAAAGHPIRLAIVEFLADGEQCVCDITAHLGAGQSNVSKHLAILLQAGLVDHRKVGLRMLYSLRRRCILRFLECVSEVIRQQLEEESQLLSQV